MDSPFCKILILVMMSLFVSVPVIQFFFGSFAQSDNLHIELQFRACKGMIEIKADSLVIETFHERKLMLTIFVADI